MHLAVDLGAGSGRALLGRLDPEGLHLREVHRFHYPPGRSDGRLRWPMAVIREGIVDALRAAAAVAEGGVATLGVDSWAVDYGLLDEEGRLLEDPICYRDERTAGVIEQVLARVPQEELFARTGIQFLPFNTVYQLFAHVREGLPRGARRLLMIPDLCHHMLCGATSGEYTNATSTQLLGACSRLWDEDLFARLDLPRELMPELRTPGTDLGTLRRELQEETGLGPSRVFALATHDTASAVAGTPLEPGWAYVSSGTWSLVGLEREAPLLSAEAARANVTNEGGVFGTYRLLKNVMGLWILESLRREWAEAGRVAHLDRLLDEVARLPGAPALIFPDDTRFLNPPSMTAEIEGFLRETSQHVPDSPPALARVVLDSLALRYASVLRTLEALTGRSVAGVHIVGGGSRNGYLNQATAEATGKPVRAGPAEATAIGNVAVQAIASGEVRSLAEARRLVAAASDLAEYRPRGEAYWREATARYTALEGLRV